MHVYIYIYYVYIYISDKPQVNDVRWRGVGLTPQPPIAIIIGIICQTTWDHMMLTQHASAAQGWTTAVQPPAIHLANIAALEVPCPVPIPALVCIRPVPVPVPDRYLNGRREQSRGPRGQRAATHVAKIHFERICASSMCYVVCHVI